MDLSRRRPDAPRDLARRRLELLGAQLHGTGTDDERPSWPVGPETPGAHGRHRAAGPVDPPDAGEVAAPAARASAPVGRWSTTWRALAGDRPVRRQHLLAVAVGVLLAAVAALWWVTTARPEAVRPLGAEATAVLDDGSGGSAPVPEPDDPPAAASASPTPAAEVVVDVTGKVRTPGIVTLPTGARVADALEAAGGARPGTSLTSLNLARVLVDGEQVVVGLPAVAAPAPAGPSPPAGGTPAAGTPAAQVELNTATLEQLDTLPGVGPVTGQAILDHRAEIGRFTSVEELLDVRGIGEATLAELRDLVTVR